MTTPWISSIRPAFRFLGAFGGLGFLVGAANGFSLTEAFGPGDDFQNLLRDLRLAFAVHLQGQVLDDVPRVLGRIAHRGHARAVLGGGRLQQRAEDRDLDVRRDQALEDVVGVGFVLDERALALVLLAVLGLLVLAL